MPEPSWPPLLEAALDAEEVARLLEGLATRLGKCHGVTRVRFRPRGSPPEDWEGGWAVQLPVLLGELEVRRPDRPGPEEAEALVAAARQAADSLGAGLAEALLAHGAQALQLLAGGGDQFFYYVHDTDGVFTYVSPSVRAITGRDPEDWKRHYSTYFTDNPINTLATQHTQWTLEDGSGSPSYLVEIRHAEGHAVLLRVHEQPLRRGQEILGIHGLAMDVTRWYSIERELLRSEERYRTLFEQAQDGILVADTAGVLCEANPAACRLLETSRETLQGRTLEGLLPEELRAASPGTPQVVFHPASELELEWNIQELPDGRRLIFLRDVTRVVRAAEERRALEQQLVHAQRFESLGRLASGVAHDVNNILTVIRAHAEMLEQATAPAHAVDLEGIQHAVQRAAELTGRLLEFSHRSPRRPERLRLDEQVDRLRPMLHSLLGGGVRLELDLDPSVPAVEADALEVEQILLNLVVNARDALEGQGAIRIRVAQAAEDQGRPSLLPGVAPGQALVLSVHDDGPGIPPEVRERIFEPFFTTKERGKGTGLGLAIVQALATRNGGAVRLLSDGAGSTFEVLFPASLPGPDSVPARSGITILVVDDEEPVLALVQRILAQAGHEVLTARTGAEAAAALEAAPAVHLLVADVVLAGETGLDVARRLRQLQPRLPLLFISGHLGAGSSLEVEREFRELEAGFLAKPFTRRSLMHAVDQALGAVRGRGPAAGR